ncbi:DNA mismatch repair protein MutS [Caldisalinibacter kiritimatiensis]|uniref:DNA mismatch repair protein MutS n=1 Tax=Caldisalinibacter kiritimatiensis TaxID=1304284 RepID=R1AWP3_9FIRM|nr:DNA mismatch repair protein MutS [Caldisalinibacter kiritimatiensis]EOD01047.1 DNA mismatch repair protein MutS [Caldisalinibacter kiritimatiensis]
MAKLTPMMQQYMDIKEKYKDTILFFRLGDFYEMFFDDAITASKELEITLTSRDCGKGKKAPMCGVPFHSADSYIAKLVEKGYKVAICEQIEDPAKAKGIVKRDVVRIITPGTITDLNILDEKSNNYLCCLYIDDIGVGISYVDISTGDLYTTEIHKTQRDLFSSLMDELSKIQPTEIIANSNFFNYSELVKDIENRFNTFINRYYDWAFDIDTSEETIKNQLKVISLEGYGLKSKNHSIVSTGALIEYVKETQKIALEHINSIKNYTINKYMMMDISTRRNLELTETIRGKSKKGSLLWLLDKTSTAMGGRLLKRWIEEPLIDSSEINKRLDAVDELTNNLLLMDEIKGLLDKVYDIERLMGKVVYGSCNARDLISLKNSISVLPSLKSSLSIVNSQVLNHIHNELDTLEDIHKLIDASILDDPPVTIKEGGIIKSGYNIELDELREASNKGKEWLSKLQESERSRTGIKKLKVGYNKVFGYYIEVTKSYLDLVPENYTRKQTLANSERYITPELKEMEAKILGAEERSMNLEYELFVKIRDSIRAQLKRIQKTAKTIATIDVLNSLAQVAYKNNYVKPKLNNNGVVDIKEGRHPVVEKMLNGELFIPNDTLLNNNDNRISIITGPNMAGKSTYMRQVALIVLMAHIGSFVPATEANIAIVDKIFTRVGASDDLSQGQSTFMVEMSEVANILNNATKNSLLILDEIGRGTSTYDGLSIAKAVVEFISDKYKLGAKTLFATHYHELTELENRVEGVKNYRILVKEEGDDIVFLRKIVSGGANRSYGIEVAKLAGVPNQVIERAKEILKELEEKNLNRDNIAVTKQEVVEENKQSSSIEEEAQSSNYQLNLFSMKQNDIIKKLKDIDPMQLTPLDSLNILYKLSQEAKKL